MTSNESHSGCTPFAPPFLAAIRLLDQDVLVVGGGAVAFQKMRAMLRAGARVRVVAREASAPVLALSRNRQIELEEREFRAGDIGGQRIAIAATNDASVNQRVLEECRAKRVLVNVVDDPERCDFYVPATVDRGRVVVGITTSGASPALAAQLRQELDGVLHPSLSRYAELLASARERVRARWGDDPQMRARANAAVVGSGARGLLERGDDAGAERAIHATLEALMDE